MTTTRTLEIGAMCEPISKQLDGLISSYDAEMLDRDNNAITRCHVMGYMSDSACDRARKKLIKKCQHAVRYKANPRASVSADLGQ